MSDPIIGIHLDLKFVMPRKAYLHDWVRRLASYGVNALLIEYEDKFPFSKYPFLRAADAFTEEELIQSIRFAARHLPPRVASVLGTAAAVLLLVGLVNGVVVAAVLDFLDASYRKVDALVPPDMQAPQAWDSPGSAQSLVAWNELGRMGRRYVAARPDAAAT